MKQTFSLFDTIKYLFNDFKTLWFSLIKNSLLGMDIRDVRK